VSGERPIWAHASPIPPSAARQSAAERGASRHRLSKASALPSRTSKAECQDRDGRNVRCPACGAVMDPIAQRKVRP
jgi:hypothetical protein